MEVVPTFFNKPTAAIHSSHKYTVTEMKLLNIVFELGNKDNFESETYFINIWDTLQMVGSLKSHNSQWLKEELFPSLASKIVRWNILKKDKTIQEWSCPLLIALIKETSTGKLGFQFNPNVIKHLQHHTLYSKLMLEYQLPIKSKYAMKLYEYINDELHRSSQGSKNIELSIVNLRLILGVGEDDYSQFKHLNSQVIKPAFAEINKFTDIGASFSFNKDKRTIVAIRISAYRKTNFQLSFDLSNTDRKAAIIQPESALQLEAKAHIVELLMAYKVTKAKALKLSQTKSPQQIIDSVKYASKQKNVKNFAPYLVTTIEKNYGNNSSDFIEDEKELEKRWHSHRSQQTDKKFDALSDKQQARLRKEFHELIHKDAKYQLTKTKFKNEMGWQSRYVQFDFSTWLQTSMLKESYELDIDIFKKHLPLIELKKMLEEAQKTVKNRTKTAGATE